jgi:hypothetical protein
MLHTAKIRHTYSEEILFRNICDWLNHFYSYRVYQLRSTESQRVSDQVLVDEKLRSTESQRVSDLQLVDEKVLFDFSVLIALMTD